MPFRLYGAAREVANMFFFCCSLSVPVRICTYYAFTEESNKRPLLATECESLPQAEKFRRDIIRDITKNISAIGNGE
jgi:hypothetical protein